MLLSFWATCIIQKADWIGYVSHGHELKSLRTLPSRHVSSSWSSVNGDSCVGHPFPCRRRQLRARRALLQLKDVPLRTRRALLLYKVNGNSALLVLNGTSLICNSALLALSWHNDCGLLCQQIKHTRLPIRHEKSQRVLVLLSCRGGLWQIFPLYSLPGVIRNGKPRRISGTNYWSMSCHPLSSRVNCCWKQPVTTTPFRKL